MPINGNDPTGSGELLGTEIGLARGQNQFQESLLMNVTDPSLKLAAAGEAVVGAMQNAGQTTALFYGAERSIVASLGGNTQQSAVKT